MRGSSTSVRGLTLLTCTQPCHHGQHWLLSPRPGVSLHCSSRIFFSPILIPRGGGFSLLGHQWCLPETSGTLKPPPSLWAVWPQAPTFHILILYLPLPSHADSCPVFPWTHSGFLLCSFSFPGFEAAEGGGMGTNSLWPWQAASNLWIYFLVVIMGKILQPHESFLLSFPTVLHSFNWDNTLCQVLGMLSCGWTVLRTHWETDKGIARTEAQRNRSWETGKEFGMTGE